MDARTDIQAPTSRAQPIKDEGEARIERRFVPVVRADEVELKTAGAGMVFAANEVEIDRGGARDIIAGGPVSVTRGGAGLIVSGGETTIRQGGAGTILSLGRVSIEQGGAVTMAAGSASVGQGGVVVLALTPRLEVASGGRVLGGPTAAAAAVIAMALGLLIGRVMRR